DSAEAEDVSASSDADAVRLLGSVPQLSRSASSAFRLFSSSAGGTSVGPDEASLSATTMMDGIASETLAKPPTSEVEGRAASRTLVASLLFFSLAQFSRPLK